MDIHFIEVSPHEIIKNHPGYFHGQARYFKAMKDGKALCLYGVISRTEQTGEAFLMMKTFQGKVFTKGFFIALFAHVFSLGYKEVWTWTTWDRLIKLLGHFKKFGIEKTACPSWENEPRLAPAEAGVDPHSTKTWFLKRV